jgi:hypothetical protein
MKRITKERERDREVLKTKKKLQTMDNWTAFFLFVILLATLLMVSSAIFLGAWNNVLPKLHRSIVGPDGSVPFENINFGTAIVAMIMFWAMLSPIAIVALGPTFVYAKNLGHHVREGTRRDMASYSAGSSNLGGTAHDTWKVK